MVKNKFILLFSMALTGLIGLSACKSLESISKPSITASHVPAKPTAYPYPTITPTKTSTPPSSSTTISILEETSNLPPTPTIQVPLPKIPDNFSNLGLTHPDLEILLRLQLSRSAQMVYSDSPLEDLLYPAFNDVLDFEWEQVYTHTLYSDKLFELIPNFYDHSRGRLTNQMLMDLIGDHVIQVINNQKIILKDGSNYEIPNFSGESYRVEIDADSTPEWLVKVTNWDGFYLGEYHFWITLDQIQEGQYQRLINDIPLQSGWSEIHPNQNFQDFDGDGIIDIVILEKRPGFGQGLIVPHVALGKPDGFHLISSTIGEYPEDSYEHSSTEYNWITSPENGLPGLEIIQTRILTPWECQVTSVSEYQWRNGIQSVTDAPLSVPDTAICDIARAMDSQDTPDRETQIRLLNQAFDHPGNLSTEYQVFVLYRLALLYALEENDAVSRKSIERISDIAQAGVNPIATNLITQIQPLLTENLIFPYKLCLATENIAKDIPEDLWSPITGALAYPYEGYSAGYPSPLCDTREIQMEVLNKIDLPSEISPETVETQLIKAGISIRLVQPIENQDSIIGWLILIDNTNPDYPADNAGADRFPTNDYTYAVWKIGNQDWQILTTFDLVENRDSIFVNSSDLTGDGIPEISIAYPNLSLLETDCIDNNIPYTLRTMTAIKDNWLVDYSETICQPADTSTDFKTILQDKNGDGIVDRTAAYFEEKEFEAGLMDLELLSEIPNENPWMVSRSPYWEIMQYINKAYILEDLNARFFETTNPADLQSEIEFYRDRWGTDDEIGRNIRANLNYLLGLSFELEGEKASAVELYFNIWRDQPDTIWSYLAASKVAYR